MTATLKRAKSEMDLTSGSILKKMFFYSIPFIFTNILQILFNAADVAVIGIFRGDDAVAAVGANTTLSGLLVSFFVAFSMGSNVVLARYVGAKDVDNARKTVATSILLAIIAGVLLALIGVPLAPTFLKWMACDPAILDMATVYLRIYFLGMPVTMLYNFCASILRAVGDTKRPLVFLLIGGVTNVLLNLFFVCVLNKSVEGVAIATITSQAISAVLSLIVLCKGTGYATLKKEYLGIHKKQLVEIFKIALPSGIQSIAFNISNVLIQSTINSFGAVGMSANTTAQQYDAVIYNIGNAVAMSSMAFVSQNVGAKRMDRVKTSIFCGMFLGTILTLSVGLLFAILSPVLCGIIASSQEVIDMAVIRLSIMSVGYFICAIMEVFSYSLRALGRSVLTLIISVLGSVVIRILFVNIAFSIVPEFYIIFLAYPVSWLTTVIAYVCVVPGVYKKVKRKIEMGGEL